MRRNEGRGSLSFTGPNIVGQLPRQEGATTMQRHVRVGILLLCVLFPQGIRADFFDGLGVGARAIAMGSAYTAVADDLTAVYYNPAGLAQVEKHALFLGYLWSSPCLEESSPNDPSFHARQVIPYKLQAPIVGIGFNLDKGFKGNSPIHARLAVLNSMPDNFKSIYRVWDPESSVPRWVRFGDYWDRVHLMGGLSLQADKIPWLAVGLGFRYIISGNEYLLNRYGTTGLTVTTEDLFSNTRAEANLDMGVDTEVTPTAGVMITPTKNLRLGYRYLGPLSLLVSPVETQAQTHIILKGESHIIDIPIPLGMLMAMEGYYWPQQHSWGVSYRWGEDLLLSLDLSWFRWSKFASTSRGRPDPGWKDSIIPRLGIEYLVLPSLALRCGYFFEPSPVPDQVRVSNFLDNDRHVFSIGAGYTFRDPWHIAREPIVFDVVFQYMHMPTRKTTKDPDIAPLSSYETQGDVYTAGANITFSF